jgi:hypothetical protein
MEAPALPDESSTISLTPHWHNFVDHNHAAAVFIRPRGTKEIHLREDPPAISGTRFILQAGEQLRGIRSRLEITTRDVAELIQKIAQSKGNLELDISNPWLN